MFRLDTLIPLQIRLGRSRAPTQPHPKPLICKKSIIYPFIKVSFDP